MSHTESVPPTETAAGPAINPLWSLSFILYIHYITDKVYKLQDKN